MLLRFLALSFFVPFMLFAQETGGGLSLENFGSLAGLVAGVVILTGLYKQFISGKNTFIVAVIISTLACATGFYFQIGVFLGLQWWGALLYDVGIVLIFGNKVSIDVVVKLFEAIKIAPKSK